MKIRSLELKNFRNYRGEHKLDLAMNGEEGNIALIGGANGAGKTSLFKAVKTCLFGKKQNGKVLTNPDYHNYLYSLTNKEIRDDKAQSHIRMNVELNSGYPTQTLDLKRSWNVENGEIVNENFAIKKDNEEPLELVPEEYWEDYACSLSPPHVSQFFLFGGEEIKSQITGQIAENNLRESVRDALGLRMHEKLTDDLERLESQIKRNSISKGKNREKLEKLEDQLSGLESELKSAKSKIMKKEKKISELEKNKIQIEEKLHKEASEFASKREKIKGELSTLKEKRKSINKRIEELCENYLPFVIPKKTGRELVSQLEKEQMIKRRQKSQKQLRDLKERIPEEIEKRENITPEFSREEVDLIKTEMSSIIKEIEEEKNKGEKGFLHDLTSSKTKEIKRKVGISKEKIEEELPYHLEKKEEISLKISDLREKLKKIPDQIFVEESIEKISETKSNIDHLHKEVEDLEEKIPKLEEDINETEGKIKKIEDSIYSGREAEKKVKISSRVREAEEEFIDRIISSRIGNLEKNLTNFYQTLSNKEDMVEKVEIDEENFSVNLVDSQENLVKREEISTGEKEIFAVSLLWGLAKMSSYELPVMMDAPLSTLGETHVENIVENFLPNAGRQVIIFSTKNDIDQELYEKLKPHVYRTYTISLESENKIHKGYYYG